ncbi:MAG: nicotinate phosphoribosyltransferase [Bacteroidota bacterium]
MKTPNHNLSLLTDLYQLTMAYGYWKNGWMDKEAAFNLFFRKLPFGGRYAVAAGLESVCQFIENFGFSDEDISYLATLKGNDQKPLFEKGFLEYLRKLEFSCDIDAVPEGTLVFPNEPLIRVMGPIIQCQIIESTLLNLVNFPTLIATKAARIVEAAGDMQVLEFGLRRAQGIDGALTAARSAYVGGCAATSNAMAGRLYGIPVKGTHAHSWVMSHDTEQLSFNAYAQAMPNNCIFLVDTYDTIEGVKKAIETGLSLRQDGYEMVGIRLDSGDLAALSIEARKLLDEAAFPDAKIVASNDLDEYRILDLKRQGAKIDIWGVGTRLVTASEQASLGGVYKLSAIKEKGAWRYKLKLSEQKIKISNPGIQQVKRFYHEGIPVKDIIYDELTGIGVDGGKELLLPVCRNGKVVYELPELDAVRENTLSNVLKFTQNPDAKIGGSYRYPVELSGKLSELKKRLIGENSTRVFFSQT